MADVFLSYSRADQAPAAAVAQALAEAGYAVRDRRTSDDGRQAIDQVIDSAAAVLVIWSRSARESLWVRAVATAALDQNKLVQLNADGASLPMPFATAHYHDLRGWGGGRDQMPWPQVEEKLAFRSADELGGRRPDPGGIAFLTVPERPLLELGQVAYLGWAAIVTALLTGVFTVAAARGNIGADEFGVVTLVALICSVGLLALASLVLARTSVASR